MKNAVPRMVTGRCILFVCDIQERFRDRIVGMPLVIATAKLMLDCAHILKIPAVVTEQYPKAFGQCQTRLQMVFWTPFGDLLEIFWRPFGDPL